MVCESIQGGTRRSTVRRISRSKFVIVKWRLRDGWHWRMRYENGELEAINDKSMLLLIVSHSLFHIDGSNETRLAGKFEQLETCKRALGCMAATKEKWLSWTKCCGTMIQRIRRTGYGRTYRKEMFLSIGNSGIFEFEIWILFTFIADKSKSAKNILYLSLSSSKM